MYGGDLAILGPLRVAGKGTIELGDQVVLGWPESSSTGTPTMLQARELEARISVGAGTRLSSGVQVIACERVSFGRRCLVGPEAIVYDSDFHGLRLDERNRPGKVSAVTIGDDVFIGTRAMILKGVAIGDGAVVAAGATVIRDVAPMTIVGGNPASLIGPVPC